MLQENTLTLFVIPVVLDTRIPLQKELGKILEFVKNVINLNIRN